MSVGDSLTGLGSILAQQFNLSDNKNTSLDIVRNGQTIKFGKLGDFANQFDQSADRSYTEQGSSRPNFFAPKPNVLDVLMQNPDATVFIKKRAFSSLAENYRPDLMDDQERLLYKATKVLFQNKCKQISNYEKLVKIAQISNAVGGVDQSLLPMIFSFTDNLNQLPGAFGAAGLQTSINTSLSNFTSIVNRVREVVALSNDNLTTTWLTNIPDSFRSSFGEGTGVIELTVVKRLSTTTSIHFGQGSFSLSIEDPYNLLRISNNDVDQALYDANNVIYNNQFVQLGIQALDQTISLQQNELNFDRQQRGAGTITFTVNPQTYLGQRVTAVIDNIGFQIQFDGSAFSNALTTRSVKFDSSALIGSPELGQQGLNQDEQKLFSSIVGSLYTQLSIAANSNRTSRQSNQQLTYVRNALRSNYAGKLIIQPMDTVNIYIKSQTKKDNKVSSGLESSFSGQTWLQGVQTTISSLSEFFGSNNSSSVEKSFFVGSDFPNWIWLAMRNQFISIDKGCHVFAGVVHEAQREFNDGFYNVSVSGGDNTKYFDYGIINFKPAVDVFNGSLYDPITPFDIKFDSVTGVQQDSVPDLLTENKALMTSAFIRNKSGVFAGMPPTESTYLNQDAQQTQSANVNRVFYDPDGFVYRWKQGIGTLVLFGNSFSEQPINQQAPAITDDPFAGQDMMNVLSLLITGEPYNYATFFKAAAQFDSFNNDPTTGADASQSYFRGLQNQLKRRNFIYGNFIPFKRLTVDEKSYTSMLSFQASASNFNSQLQDLLSKRAAVSDKLTALTGGKPSNTGNTPDQTTLINLYTQQITQYDRQISSAQKNLQNHLNSIDAPITIYGNDISFDYSPSLTIGDKTRLDPSARQRLRREVNFLTRRLIYQVRANEDKNLFIVDDAYDKDTDIQAFEKAFTNMSLFKSDYITTSEQIKRVASPLELEIFANTQGHIEARNPQYNRTPSSVFYNMLKLKRETGAQVFPQFIEDLYLDQLSTLQTQIEVLEDEIRLYCLSVGFITDATCSGFISDSTGSLSTGSPGDVGFDFLSSPNTGTISADFRFVVQASNPDDALGAIDFTLSSLQEGQLNLQNTFDAARIATLIQSNSNNPGTAATDTNNQGQFQNLSSLNSTQYTTRENLIVGRLNQKTGQQFDITQIFGSANGGQKTSNTVSSSDLLTVLNNIGQRISARQQAIKTMANALKNLEEGLSLDTKNSQTANTMLFPNLNTSTQIPQMFEHLIEDESYDDLGPGSGARYVIKNQNIFQYSIAEKRPEFTAVEVTGRLDLFISNSSLPPDLNAFQSGGNALTTAAAVDYDLWRQYGITLPQTVDAPFLTDPDSQCAPYAVSILNRVKKNVLQGSISVVGNEYQQPGEVVYHEDEDLLFYVESVNHDFTFGGNFHTTMNVGYGHSPGQYIPSPYDVIGKILYKNKDITNYVHNRQGSVFNQQYLGTLVGAIQSSSSSLIAAGDPADDLINGQYGQNNTVTLQNILTTALGILSTTTSTYTPVLELRIFYNSDGSFPSINPYTSNLASAAINYLIGATGLTNDTKPEANTNKNIQSLANYVKTKQIKVQPVNSSTTITDEYRFPSKNAYYLARSATNVGANSSSPTELQSYYDSVIYNSIVDCWIVFTNTSS